MRSRLKKITLATMTALTLTLAGPAANAFAIDNVSCDDRVDFVQLTSGFVTRTCFANAGSTAVNIGEVFHLTSGNNKTTVSFEFDGRYYYVTLDPWQSYNISEAFGSVRVYEVRIW